VVIFVKAEPSLIETLTPLNPKQSTNVPALFNWTDPIPTPKDEKSKLNLSINNSASTNNGSLLFDNKLPEIEPLVSIPITTNKPAAKNPTAYDILTAQESPLQILTNTSNTATPTFQLNTTVLGNDIWAAPAIPLTNSNNTPAAYPVLSPIPVKNQLDPKIQKNQLNLSQDVNQMMSELMRKKN